MSFFKTFLQVQLTTMHLRSEALAVQCAGGVAAAALGALHAIHAERVDGHFFRPVLWDAEVQVLLESGVCGDDLREERSTCDDDL